MAGEILHRESLGNKQLIRPGQVNLMTAGLGIAHTEDSPHPGQHLHAAQLWIALPPEQRDCPPDFAHHPDLPTWTTDGARFTLLAGYYQNNHAPSRIHTPLLGLDIAATTDATLDLPLQTEFEYGLLPLLGHITVAGDRTSIAEAQRQWENGDPRFGPIGDGGELRLMPPPLPSTWG